METTGAVNAVPVLRPAVIASAAYFWGSVILTQLFFTIAGSGALMVLPGFPWVLILLSLGFGLVGSTVISYLINSALVGLLVGALLARATCSRSSRSARRVDPLVIDDANEPGDLQND